jgi:hypothetical protein
VRERIAGTGHAPDGERAAAAQAPDGAQAVAPAAQGNDRPLASAPLAHRLLALQRSAGNAAVGRLLARQAHAQHAQHAQHAPTRAELIAAYRRSLRNQDWADVALRLNGFNDADIERLMPPDPITLHAIRDAAVAAMPGWSGRVTDAIDQRLEEIRVATLKKDYLRNLHDQDWPSVALRLNAFSDDDIPRFLPRNQTILDAIKQAAPTAMPGFSDRVVNAINGLATDSWPSASRDDRMLHVMDLLVDVHGFPVNGAAGLVGNLSAESGLIPSRIEGSAEATPLRAADFDGHVRDFTPYEVQYRSKSEKLGPKLPGAGLAQWTSKSRRDAFFAQGRDILFDLDGQVSFLVHELRSSFAGVNTAINAPSVTVQHAADVVLESFEAPADPEASRAARRRSAAQAAAVYLRAHPPPGTGEVH